MNIDEIPIFVINLERDKSKKAHMDFLAKKHRLEFIYINAIDGKKLTVDAVNDCYDNEGAIDAIKRSMSTSEIACALSHKMIYKKIVADSIPAALILEDDVDMDDDFKQVANRSLSLARPWDVILLGSHISSSRHKDVKSSKWMKHQLTEKHRIAIPVEMAYGAYGYLVSYEGAKNCLKHCITISMPADHITGNSRLLNLYCCQPSVITVNNSLLEESNLHNEREALKIESTNNYLRTSPQKKILLFTGLYAPYTKIQTVIKAIFKSYAPPLKKMFYCFRGRS